MKYQVWVHDPCPEGGWMKLGGPHDTLEKAREIAKAHHERESKDRKEYISESRISGGGSWCYDGYCITSDVIESESIV